jgi:hypothetical protein
MKLRDYQKTNSEQIVKRLLRSRIAYLAAQVRTGKTITALDACRTLQNTQPSFNVLFITKKNAIGSIEADAKALGITYNLTVTNYEGLHKLPEVNRWDVIICDELHCLSGYPKPSKRFKSVRALFDDYTYLIGLSGTPHPETKAQLFHQFNVSPNSPWSKYNFYQWAKKYCDVYQKNFGYGLVNQYDKALDNMIDPDIEKYMINFTQTQAGFDNQVNEHVLYADMLPSTYNLIDILKRDRVYEGKKGLILADTAVKLQNKIHQLWSGTIKYEDGTSMIGDMSKGQFIKDNFKNKKLAIFYYYKKELDLLRILYPNNTNNSLLFNKERDITFIGQIRSCREGINLSTADALIFYNIEFSCVSYIQAKDRMTSKDRTIPNDVYYIFSKGGIEEKIYNRVRNKEDYSNSIFRKDFGIEEKNVQLDMFS